MIKLNIQIHISHEDLRIILLKECYYRGKPLPKTKKGLKAIIQNVADDRLCDGGDSDSTMEDIEQEKDFAKWELEVGKAYKKLTK